MINIDKLIGIARTSGSKERLETLKLIKSEFLKAQTAPKREIRGPLSETEEIRVLQGMVKSRKDSIEAYTKAGRSELVEKEKKEIEVINEFLPKAPDSEEIREEARKFLSGLPEVSMKSMGPLMSHLKTTFPAVLPSELSKIAKELIV